MPAADPTPETTDETSAPSDTGEGGTSRFGPIGSRVLALLVAVFLAALGLAASIVFTIALLLTGVVSLSSFAGTPGTEAGMGLEVLVAALVATEVGFLLVGLLYVFWRLDLAVRIPTRREAGWTVATVVAALVAANGLYALAGELGLDPARSVIDAGGGLDPVVYLAIGALSIVLVGPAEELLFRGAIQGRLRRSFGPTMSILVASALFASFHVFNFQGSLLSIAFATGIIGVVGAVLGIAYERTGNLAVPILAHGIYNAILTTVAYVFAVGWF